MPALQTQMVIAVRRRERTVFDGIEPDESLSPRVIEIDKYLIQAWEEDMARRDEKIADMLKCRAAAARNLAKAKRRLNSKT